MSDRAGHHRAERGERRHVMGRMAGLALLTAVAGCAAGGAVVPATRGGAPAPVPTAPAGTGRTVAHAPVVGAIRVPVDPWCAPPPASLVLGLQAAYRKAHPSARQLPVTHRLLLVGDSTACTLLPGLVAAAPYYGIEVEDAAVVGCGVVSGRLAPDIYGGVDVNKPSAACQGRAVAAETTGVEVGRPDIVLWSSVWERAPLLISTAGGKQVVAASGSALWRSTLLQRIAQRLHLLRGGGATVVLLEQPPFVDLGKVSGLSAGDRQFVDMNALLGQVAAADRPGVKELDLSSLVCPGGPPCSLLPHGMWVRGDGEHYFASTALWVAEWLFPRVLALIRNA